MRDREAYTVYYDSASHWNVIFQMWGSTWPKVFPYCAFNVALMGFLSYIDSRFAGKYNIEISPLGHTFVSLVVSFLLVSRVNMGMTRFANARNFLSTMNHATRETIQCVCAKSGQSNTNVIDQEWRHEFAYRALMLLRLSMEVISYPIDKLPAWQVPELNGEELESVKEATFNNSETRRWLHDIKVYDEAFVNSMRVPIRMAYLLRKTIASNEKRLSKPLPPLFEAKLMGDVEAFLGGYYGMRTFLTTPVPFPLIQMARTFMFLYVFTVPFVMLGDKSSVVAHCFAVFLVTYGFMGLEVVAIQLDNPFGNDDNDFDHKKFAVHVYEDSYLAILDVDGSGWADKLRYRMHDQSITEVSTELSWLLAKTV